MATLLWLTGKWSGVKCTCALLIDCLHPASEDWGTRYNGYVKMTHNRSWLRPSLYTNKMLIRTDILLTIQGGNL